MQLLTSYKLGPYHLKNRTVMAPLTRCRADMNSRVPTEIMAEYYRQRATAGLIISEATVVTAKGVGYPATPGIYNNEQVKAWKRVTDQVHQALFMHHFDQVKRIAASHRNAFGMPGSPVNVIGMMD